MPVRILPLPDKMPPDGASLFENFEGFPVMELDGEFIRVGKKEMLVLPGRPEFLFPVSEAAFLASVEAE